MWSAVVGKTGLASLARNLCPEVDLFASLPYIQACKVSAQRGNCYGSFFYGNLGQMMMVMMRINGRLLGAVSTIWNFKDVRAQNVPTYRFFLNLPRRKVMIYFCQKGKKNGGSPCSFSRS